MKYEDQEDGDLVSVPKRGYRMMCCDCGLVHRCEFRTVKKGRGTGVMLRMWRDNRATAAARRKR